MNEAELAKLVGLAVAEAGGDPQHPIFQMLQYAWVVGAGFIYKLMDRIKQLEQKSAQTPTLEEVDSKVEAKLGKVEKKLDRIETILWDMKGGVRHPDHVI